MAANPHKVPVPTDRHTIRCWYCDQPMEIGTRAISANCRHCGKPLRFQDVRIDRLQPKNRTIDTYGNILVGKKGNCWADRIFCGTMVAHGQVNGPVVSRGLVHFGPKAQVKGDVTAPALAVEAGAILEGHYRVGQVSR
jgi:hypothetical protein